jgi:hypothetical protein
MQKKKVLAQNLGNYNAVKELLEILPQNELSFMASYIIE